MKGKKAFKFITWGFIWKSYLPLIGLELDVVYTVGFWERKPTLMEDFSPFGDKMF